MERQRAGAPESPSGATAVAFGEFWDQVMVEFGFPTWTVSAEASLSDDLEEAVRAESPFGSPGASSAQSSRSDTDGFAAPRFDADFEELEKIIDSETNETRQKSDPLLIGKDGDHMKRGREEEEENDYPAKKHAQFSDESGDGMDKDETQEETVNDDDSPEILELCASPVPEEREEMEHGAEEHPWSCLVDDDDDVPGIQFCGSYDYQVIE